MHIKEIKIEKYCHESDSYTLTALLSEKVNLGKLKKTCESYQTLILPNCLLIYHGKRLIHIYENGYCILNSFHSVEAGKIFLNQLLLKGDV